MDPRPRAIPDPVALTQGHRAWRLARAFEAPAWFCGLVIPLVFGVDELIWKFVIVLLVTFVVVWLWGGRGTWRARVSPVRGSPVLSEVNELLVSIDWLIERLERGEDRRFNLEVPNLGVTLDLLGPEAQRYLDERGVDRARLRNGVCTWNPEARVDAKLSAESRRAIHQELHRFVTLARGRPCGDPYRSRASDSPALQTVLQDAALRRARIRCAALLSLIGACWLLTWYGMLALQFSVPNPLCKSPPFFERCPDHAVRELTRIIAFAFLPMFSLLAAAVSRRAAWQSWAAALPARELERMRPGSALLARYRWRRRARWLGRALVVLAVGFVIGCMLASIHSVSGFGRTSDYGSWRPARFHELLVIIELATLSLVAIPAVFARLARDGDVRARTQLFELTLALEDSTPVRGELLERLAATLAHAKALGRLDPHDRDVTVARLQAAAERGPALSDTAREQLIDEVRCCERLITLAARR